MDYYFEIIMEVKRRNLKREIGQGAFVLCSGESREQRSFL